MQDQLAALFARQMAIGNNPPISYQYSEDSPAANLRQFPSSAAHSIPLRYPLHREVQLDRGYPQSQMKVADTDEVLSGKKVLKKHDIEASSLPMEQMDLFERASGDQQMRPIDMWQRESQDTQSAVTDGVEENGSEDYKTSLYELNNGFPRSEYYHQGTRLVDPMQLDMGGSRQSINGTYDLHNAEPYMVSGYETQQDHTLFAEPRVVTPRRFQLSRNEIPTGSSLYNIDIDPVFQGRRWWEQTETGLEGCQISQFQQMTQTSD